ncbi:hypothetical protein OHB14_30015 [Streptomyces sp. NBC_01613]|uniref:hypothetical protein n=1 Tax=Streptomyces sp. NBC_01613 TaxID=2975896 RepID=UPI00386CE138
MSGAALASDGRALEAVRAIGARCGVDYTDDAAVTALLGERRRVLERRGPLAWWGALALTVGVVWLCMAPTLSAPSGKPALAFAPPAALLVLGIACLTLVHARWKRELLHGTLVGYREVLGVARAHGVPVTHVPAWLEGRTSGGGKGAAPVPAYPKVEPLFTQAAQEQPAAAAARTAPVPSKPPAVTAYESMADAGGWHDETGCLLVMAGAGGAIWAATSDAPIGYGALVLVPLAILVWLAGSRQGKERTRLRAEAQAYVRTVAAAQSAGARVPELSPVLRKLLDEGAV